MIFNVYRNTPRKKELDMVTLTKSNRRRGDKSKCWMRFGDLKEKYVAESNAAKCW